MWDSLLPGVPSFSALAFLKGLAKVWEAAVSPLGGLQWNWDHVGTSWASIGPQIAIWGVFWAILAPCTDFELGQE